MRTVFFIVFVSVLLASASAGAADNPNVESTHFVRSKSHEPLQQKAHDFLVGRDGDTVKVWVFFTDKYVFTQEDFDIVSGTVHIPDRTMTRRSKVGMSQVVFADLPVAEPYVNKIVNLGGKLRRASKWLNAASFEIPQRQLETIASLPFVATIKPVAGSAKRDDPQDITVPTGDTPDITPPAVELNYGSSEYQLQQISVPEVHAKGFDGSGVTVAIFDTGFRKSHEAFAPHFAEGRVLGEWDFIYDDDNTANEPWEIASVESHGTICWSVLGGHKDGRIYGPAYKANFLLAKTEDKLSETPVEEDNWIAALEWADSAGADVISSSLGYLDWYTWEDMDGETAPITIAANTASDLGILLCNAVGNEGPGEGTLIAPSDAHDILAVGAVDVLSNLATFSSRGPTYDGRTKPEVCARGVSTYCATSNTDISYGFANGTSLATPLVAGAACLLMQVYPTFPPDMIRKALMETACQADAPDNNYGWGIIDANAATGWPAAFYADTTTFEAPGKVKFTCTSPPKVHNWQWSFGDGASTHKRNPSHLYEQPGVYTVTLTAELEGATVINEKRGYILAYADTLSFPCASALAGEKLSLPVYAANSQPLDVLTVPFKFTGTLGFKLDSVSLGVRTSYFEKQQWMLWDPWHETYALRITADDGDGSPPLEPGSGEILRLHVTIDESGVAGQELLIDTACGTFPLTFVSEYASYTPKLNTGTITLQQIVRGDADNNQRVDIQDPLYIIEYLLNGGPAPATSQSADANADLVVDIDDAMYLIDCIFKGGPPPPTL